MDVVSIPIIFRWGFLALYFIPGLTEEQLAGYLQRLAPHHQDFLQRRGLGHMLGDNFMRTMIGNNRWRPQSIETDTRSAVVAVRRLEFDSDVEDDDEEYTSTNEASNHNPLSSEVDDRVSTSEHSDHHAEEHDDGEKVDEEEDDDNSIASAEERERQLNVEGELIISAAVDGVLSLINTAFGYANRYAFDTVVEPTSSLVARVGFGTSFIALGLGFGGMAAGYYNRPNMRFPTMSPTSSMLPSSQTLWTTAAIGAASAGVMLYSRSLYRRMVKPLPPPPPTSRRKSGSKRK